ncbi:hypothetical protein [uncultured Gilliamella sp.]|uniref:hypothetical protein n=1 Tax=uncultured Gilliamella sp. TaxID=1193505 RepID=UPI0025DE90A8|nr:hypothetical protein [uncultured Gilliamella sp.]
MATKKKIETPGAANTELDTALGTALDTAQTNVTTIETKAKNIDEAIAQNQAVIDDANALEDEKAQAQLKLDALLETKTLIDATLVSAKLALESIQNQVQQQAATVRKTDMSAVNVQSNSANPLASPHVELTEAGYVIKARTQQGAKE